jgi:hypothetical protein
MSSAARYWAICCPGPSLSRRETVSEMLKTNPDKIVAVNIAIMEDVKFDYWSVQDIEVFRSVSHFFDSFSARFWIPERWLIDIPEYHEDLLCKFTPSEKETFPSDRVDQFAQLMPFGRHINWREFTMITAIGLAVMKGATLIRIYGADLSGKGYHRQSMENERTIHNDKRWAMEKARLDEVTREAEKHGIKIIREVF